MNKTTVEGFLVVLLLSVGWFPVSVYGYLPGESSAVVYKTFGTTRAHQWTLRMGFWEDPDLSPNARETLYNTLDYLARRLIRDLGEDLTACRFGILEIYPITDYKDLLEQRRRGDFFDILHCDQAVYLLGKQYLPPGLPDPYEILMEETPASDATPTVEAGIWVCQDSPIETIWGKLGRDLQGRHVAVVDDHCLLGGVLQRARLAAHPDTPEPATGEVFDQTNCGSVSDAILRLLTGLATDKPIEAAFLPIESPGYRVAREALGLRKEEKLPIRLLKEFKAEALPGRPLLIGQYLRDCDPTLRRKLADFFARQRVPFRWKTSSPERYRPLEKELEPLLEKKVRQP